MNLPRKPKSGQRVLQSLYNSVCDIIDYLPSLSIRNTDGNICVTNSPYGVVLNTKNITVGGINTTNTIPYIFGKGLTSYIDWRVVSGSNVPVEQMTRVVGLNISGDNQYISAYQVTDGSLSSELYGGWRIAYIGPVPSGGGGSDTNTLYIGDANLYSIFSGNHIYVDPEPLSTDPNTHVIYSTLYWIKDLANDPAFYSPSGSAGQIREDMLSTASFPSEHFIQTKDLLYQKGTNAIFTSGGWKQNVSPNAIEIPDPEDPNKTITVYLKHWTGFQVDCVLTGGRFTEVNSHWASSYLDADDHTINCLLSGDNSHIFISEQSPNEDGSWGGIISTNIHGDGTTVTMDADGTLHAVGGGTVVASGVPYPNYQELRHDDYGSVSGIGISWLLPVKKNSNVCFYTAAGSEHAYATFATHEIDEDDHYERATIYNGEPYVPSTDGWVRLSVFDDGTHAGECLRFTDNYDNSSSWNYATPLYRFHGFKELVGDGTTIGIVGNTISGRYTGDGSKIQVQGNTISWIGGSTDRFGPPDYSKLSSASDPGTSNNGQGVTFLIPVSKNSSVKYQTGGNHVLAIWAPCEGSTAAASAITTSNKNTTEDGWVRVTAIDDGLTPNACLKIYVNNKPLPLYKFGASKSISAGTGLYFNGNTLNLSTQYATDLATINNRSGNKVLSSSNGTLTWATNTAGGGSFAPDYSYLSASEDAGMTTNGLGVTFLLPVNAGDTYRVESTGPTVVCTFAPVANSSTETTNVAANSTLTADVDGWVRVSVIDPGTSNGACVRFMVNGVPFANGLPLYKSKIMQNLTGDGDTIRIENGQIKCISTPPASSTANGTAVNSKTSFCFTPDIYYAEPNVTYYTSYKHEIESDDELAYPEEDLEWQFDTDNFDEGGDIVIALPEVDYPCVVKVCNFDKTHTVVVTQDGKYIVGEDGGAQGWASGQQSDKVGFCETKVYVFQPTPIHWSSSYENLSAAIEARDGVWWMQTFT